MPAVHERAEGQSRLSTALAAPPRKGNPGPVSGLFRPRKGLSVALVFLGSPNMPKLPCVKQLQPGFVFEGLGAETVEQDDSWLTAPSLLAHLLMERPSPVQTCLKQNTGSKRPFKLTL